jgi:hypothetical protein
MKTFSVVLGILAILGLMVAFIPFLGWLNWFNIVFAMVGLIVAAVAKSRTGLILCSLAIFFGFIRLAFGGGVI